MNETKRNNQKGAVARVSGSLKYIDDINFDNSLHVKLVRLDVGHARIDSIDTSRALALPGVFNIFTADDLPSPLGRFGPIFKDQPLLADKEVNFAGQPVAAVLAETAREAELAAEKIDIQYTSLPTVTSFDEALAPGAPLVQQASLRADDELNNTNIMGEYHFGWGDVENMRKDIVTITNTFQTPAIHHYALEPYGVHAIPEDDTITLYAAIQHPFTLRRIVATLLDLPLSKVRVIATDMGGGFGGRGYPKIEPLAAQLACLAKRPVKINLTADEGFYLAQREASRVRISTGFSSNGKIVFQDIKADFLVGAYADVSPRVVQKAGFLGVGPYWSPNVKISSRGIFSHTCPKTAFRGFGATHMGFAIESQMDEAARKLNLDPVEIRIRNLPDIGETLVPGDSPVDGDWKSALRKAADAINWHETREPGVGKGIAIGIKSSVPATYSSAEVRLQCDGSAAVYFGTTEMGQGCKTVMAKLVSQTLLLPFDVIHVVAGDTGQVPFDTMTASSRSTVMMGRAVVAACEDIKAKLRAIAAEVLTASVDEVQLRDGAVFVGSYQFNYPEIMQQYFGPGLGEVVGFGKYISDKLKGHPLGGTAAFWEFIVTAIEASVDMETGEVALNRLVNVSDAGKVINPLRAKGQDEGGTVMAIGAALMERIVMDGSGRILNAGSLDYKVPTIADIPRVMETIFQENQDGPGPYGSKGVGESGILATLPAICGAVFEATGIVVREIPLTPEKLWKMIQKKQESAG